MTVMQIKMKLVWNAHCHVLVTWCYFLRGSKSKMVITALLKQILHIVLNEHILKYM
jgi:hypothetical protein